MTTKTLLDARREYTPALTPILQDIKQLKFTNVDAKTHIEPSIADLFPHTKGNTLLVGSKGSGIKPSPMRIGVVFSGGQAAGGHSVIAGIYDALFSYHEKSHLLGFLNGPIGIIEGNIEEITKKKIDLYRNVGGFDLIGSGRDKIESKEQFEKSLAVAKAHDLDGIIIIGGDDSNTNAALLAEYFVANDCKTKVIGVPKTIDGDLKNEYVETSFGFDSACKVYSEMIGNIGADCLSAKKYTHFIKLMGRSASHIALECALQVRPNLTLIGEEVKAQNTSLDAITKQIADVVESRSKNGKDYGIIVIPEGLIEFVPEMGYLISHLNEMLAKKSQGVTIEEVIEQLDDKASQTFQSLPKGIQSQLLLDRDPHGNVQVSKISTEVLFLEMTKNELKKRKFQGKFSPVNHFFGYEGRSGFPSQFDTTYCYNLGALAFGLIATGHTGYMAAIKNLEKEVSKWEIFGLPTTSLMHIEKRKGTDKPVIEKALVKLDGEPFAYFKKNRESWKLSDSYQSPGPIQFFGDESIINRVTQTLLLEK